MVASTLFAADGSPPTLSNITLAFLDDTGWWGLGLAGGEWGGGGSPPSRPLGNRGRSRAALACCPHPTPASPSLHFPTPARYVTNRSAAGLLSWGRGAGCSLPTSSCGQYMAELPGQRLFCVPSQPASGEDGAGAARGRGRGEGCARTAAYAQKAAAATEGYLCVHVEARCGTRHAPPRSCPGP
jgi:hypothetical protein